MAREEARASRAPEPDDGDYSPGNESKSARNLVLETFRGTLIDYFDYIKKQINQHIYHRNLVSSEYQSKKDYERNSRPWTIERQIDFSENRPIENFDKIQSEHWFTKQYTLFMSIVTFLLVDEWNKTEGELDVGSEVTVDGEFYIKDPDNPHYRPEINMASFYAVVNKRVGDTTSYRRASNT